MAVTSYLSCGTVVDDSGVGTLTWYADDSSTALSGSEVSSDNGVYAGVFPTSLAVTHYLKCTNFGFTSGDVPVGSTINGFEIEVRQYRTTTPTTASTLVKFVKGGSVSGNDIGTASDWATSETAVVYGTSIELGGLSWTQSDVTASNFGCVISVSMSSTRDFPLLRVHLIDQVRIRVYYTPPGPPSMTGMSSITGISTITF